MWILIDRKPVHYLNRDDIDLKKVLSVGDVIQYASVYANPEGRVLTGDKEPIVAGTISNVYRYHADVITPWGKREGVNWWDIYAINQKECSNMAVYKQILSRRDD